MITLTEPQAKLLADIEAHQATTVINAKGYITADGLFIENKRHVTLRALWRKGLVRTGQDLSGKGGRIGWYSVPAIDAAHAEALLDTRQVHYLPFNIDDHYDFNGVAWSTLAELADALRASSFDDVEIIEGPDRYGVGRVRGWSKGLLVTDAGTEFEGGSWCEYSVCGRRSRELAIDMLHGGALCDMRQLLATSHRWYKDGQGATVDCNCSQSDGKDHVFTPSCMWDDNPAVTVSAGDYGQPIGPKCTRHSAPAGATDADILATLDRMDADISDPRAHGWPVVRAIEAYHAKGEPLTPALVIRTMFEQVYSRLPIADARTLADAEDAEWIPARSADDDEFVPEHSTTGHHIRIASAGRDWVHAWPREKDHGNTLTLCAAMASGRFRASTPDRLDCPACLAIIALAELDAHREHDA